MHVQTNIPDPDFDQIAKQMIIDALSPVQADLNQLNRVIRSYLPTETKTSDQVLEHIFSGGGKRIRPALYFFCCRLFGYRGEHFFPIAAVCEYVHTASLLHDDVVDSSRLRRNKPTANSVWGDQASVLVGDLIYSRASELMAETGSLEVVSTFAKAIRLMSEGELLQLEQVFDIESSYTKYFKILNNKTAALISASCKAAGLLAGASQQEVHGLENFGLSIGMAFQLVDDALDYLGSRELFGKATLSDLKEGKITYPVLKALECSSLEERKLIEGILTKDHINTSDVKAVSGLVNKYKSAEKAIELAQQHTDSALEALRIFPESSARQDLENLGKRLVWRFN